MSENEVFKWVVFKNMIVQVILIVAVSLVAVYFHNPKLLCWYLLVPFMNTGARTTEGSDKSGERVSEEAK